jgi:hypothetical protein
MSSFGGSAGFARGRRRRVSLRTLCVPVHDGSRQEETIALCRRRMHPQVLAAPLVVNWKAHIPTRLPLSP